MPGPTNQTNSREKTSDCTDLGCLSTTYPFSSRHTSASLLEFRNRAETRRTTDANSLCILRADISSGLTLRIPAPRIQKSQAGSVTRPSYGTRDFQLGCLATWPLRLIHLQCDCTFRFLSKSAMRIGAPSRGPSGPTQRGASIHTYSTLPRGRRRGRQPAHKTPARPGGRRGRMATRIPNESPHTSTKTGRRGRRTGRRGSNPAAHIPDKPPAHKPRRPYHSGRRGESAEKAGFASIQLQDPPMPSTHGPDVRRSTSSSLEATAGGYDGANALVHLVAGTTDFSTEGAMSEI